MAIGLRFKNFYELDYLIVNIHETCEHSHILDEKTISDFRSDEDPKRKERTKTIGTFLRSVTKNWTVGYDSTAVTTEGVSFHQQFIQPVNIPKPTATIEEVREAFNGDVLLSCSCKDFQYRYRYWATENEYVYGKEETRPAVITNPSNLLGFGCKHLINMIRVIRPNIPLIVSEYKKNYERF